MPLMKNKKRFFFVGKPSKVDRRVITINIKILKASLIWLATGIGILNTIKLSIAPNIENLIKKYKLALSIKPNHLF